MKSRVLNALAAAALLLPFSGQAANFGYSFVDFSIVPEAEADGLGGDDDGDGFQLRGSLVVHQNYFAFVEIGDYEIDNGVDFTRWLIGAGGHWPINQNMDFVARGGIARYDVDYGPPAASSTSATTCARSAFTVASISKHDPDCPASPRGVRAIIAIATAVSSSIPDRTLRSANARDAASREAVDRR